MFARWGQFKQRRGASQRVKFRRERPFELWAHSSRGTQTADDDDEGDQKKNYGLIGGINLCRFRSRVWSESRMILFDSRQVGGLVDRRQTSDGITMSELENCWSLLRRRKR